MASNSSRANAKERPTTNQRTSAALPPVNPSTRASGGSSSTAGESKKSETGIGFSKSEKNYVKFDDLKKERPEKPEKSPTDGKLGDFSLQLRRSSMEKYCVNDKEDEKAEKKKIAEKRYEDDQLLEKYAAMKVAEKVEKITRPFQKAMDFVEKSTERKSLMEFDSRSSSPGQNDMSLAIEYPDSDVELTPAEKAKGDLPKSSQGRDKYGRVKLLSGTFTGLQLVGLEAFYKRHRFPYGVDVGAFAESIDANHIDVELWLESRRELTHKKYLDKGNEDLAFEFYEEGCITADGLRLEVPSVKTDSYFCVERLASMKKAKAERLKMAPKLSLSTISGYVEIDPNGELLKILVKNEGLSALVYQVKISNPENYRVSPVQAILNVNEELTMSVERKAGPAGWDRLCVEFGPVPEGVIDARSAATRTKFCGREFVRMRAITNDQLRVAK